MNCKSCLNKELQTEDMIGHCREKKDCDIYHSRINLKDHSIFSRHICEHGKEFINHLEIQLKIKENIRHIMRKSNELIKDVQNITKVAIEKLIKLNENLKDINYFREKVIYSQNLADIKHKIVNTFYVPFYKISYCNFNIGSRDESINPVGHRVEKAQVLKDIKKKLWLKFTIEGKNSIEEITLDTSKRYYYICTSY